VAEDTVIKFLLEHSPWAAATLIVYYLGRKDLAAANERYDNLQAKLIQITEDQNTFLRQLSQNGKSN